MTRMASEELLGNVSELIVVRHGETTWNAAGIMQGQASSSLNDAGRDQARAVADRLSMEQVAVAAVYSSDLERAADTANIIARKCHCPQVSLMEELRERHLGKLQGLARKEARRLEPEAYKTFYSHHHMDEPIPGGGESLNELFRRSKKALESIAEKHHGERVVVVTHGGVLRALHHHAKGVVPPGRVFNASLNVFRITTEKVWSLHIWGDVTHLTGSIAARSGADQDSA